MQTQLHGADVDVPQRTLMLQYSHLHCQEKGEENIIIILSKLHFQSIQLSELNAIELTHIVLIGVSSIRVE